MSLLKRAWLDLIRHPFKSLAIFSVIVILGSFLCGSIAIAKSTKAIRDDFLARVGLKVEITSTNTVAYDRFYAFIDYLDHKQDYYQYYDIRARLFGNVYNDQDSDPLLNGIMLNTTSEAILYEMDKGYISLSEGRLFADDELDQRAVLINDDLKAKGIKVNDDIVIEIFDQRYEYQVVGSFKAESNQNSNDIPSLILPTATVFKDGKNYMSRIYLDNIVIKLANQKYNDQFIGYLDANNSIKLGTYSYRSTTDIYAKAAAPLESLNKVSSFIMIVSLLSSLIILSILIFMFIKDRRFEFGVLLAMGEKKSRIITANLLELLFMVSVAFMIAALLGLSFTKLYSEHLIQNSLLSNDLNLIGALDIAVIREGYQIDIGPGVLLAVYYLLLDVVFTSFVIPMIYILNIKVRRLLL